MYVPLPRLLHLSVGTTKLVDKAAAARRLDGPDVRHCFLAMLDAMPRMKGILGLVR